MYYSFVLAGLLPVFEFLQVIRAPNEAVFAFELLLFARSLRPVWVFVVSNVCARSRDSPKHTARVWAW